MVDAQSFLLIVFGVVIGFMVCNFMIAQPIADNLQNATAKLDYLGIACDATIDNYGLGYSECENTIGIIFTNSTGNFVSKGSIGGGANGVCAVVGDAFKLGCAPGAVPAEIVTRPELTGNQLYNLIR